MQTLQTLYLNEEKTALVVLDQTRLPNEIAYLELTSTSQVVDAIFRLCVRGAPAIGVAGAMGLYVVAARLEQNQHFFARLHEEASKIEQARPTAVNLSWAIRRMLGRVDPSRAIGENLDALHREALLMYEEDAQTNRAIGLHGASLLQDGDGVLTHCNAGTLATTAYGTALAPMYIAAEQGKKLKIFADETRPLLQGARLTAFELHSAGLDVTLLCDNMAATLMQQGKVQAVMVGCDRVAQNGDTANKIGTMPLAICAKHFGVPFYVLGPSSTIDRACESGADIQIEQRDPSEVTSLWYEKPMAPKGVGVFNPAFDVTPGELITAIITENGIFRPPYHF